MAQNRNTSPELQVGQEDSAQTPHGPAEQAVLRPDVQTCLAAAPAAPFARTHAAPSPHLASAISGLTKSRQDARARSQADALPRQPTDTQAQPHHGFANKTRRVLH